jgi:hypothetical protein
VNKRTRAQVNIPEPGTEFELYLRREAGGRENRGRVVEERIPAPGGGLDDFPDDIDGIGVGIDVIHVSIDGIDVALDVIGISIDGIGVSIDGIRLDIDVNGSSRTCAPRFRLEKPGWTG